MLQSENIQLPILPHDAFRPPIHLLALLFPLSSPHPPHHSLSLPPSASVTAALRPGSQEQLVCLPALLTTANLWLEGTLTSLPTTQPHIQPSNSSILLDFSPTARMLHCNSLRVLQSIQLPAVQKCWI